MPSLIFTASETQTMIAVLSQIGIKGIDLEQLRIELGIQNKVTAGTRLFGLRKKLGINPKGKNGNIAGAGPSKQLSELEIETMVAVLKIGGTAGVNLEKLRADLGINNKTTVGTRLFGLRKKLGINPKVNSGAKDSGGKVTTVAHKGVKTAKRARKGDDDAREEIDKDAAACGRVKKAVAGNRHKKARTDEGEDSMEESAYDESEADNGKVYA